MLCLKLKHLWVVFALAGNYYRKCRRCYITVPIQCPEEPNDTP